MAVGDNIQLTRQPNDILAGNFIKVGDGSGNYNIYQPFAEGLGESVIKRFVEDLMGIICKTSADKYERIGGSVQRNQCMYNKIAKGGAIPDHPHACTVCVRYNRICLRKVRVGNGYVMFIAPLSTSGPNKSELGAWVVDITRPMEMPPAAQI